MWNPKLLHRLVACAAPLGAVAVLACGPDFSVQMLDDRSATLKATPANNFAFEAAHLVSASDKLSAQENQVAAPADDVRLKVMHDQADGDAAYAAGTGLPPALRLYTAAALDYRNAQAAGATAEPMLKRASQRFQAVLDLSPGDAAPRVVWSAYMLGQLHGAAMSAAAAQPDQERRQAIQAYSAARAQAIAGAPDPAGLAVASYGEQARLYLVGQFQQCSYVDFMQATACAEAIPAADLKQAIRLYAEQAARDSGSAVDSLALIAQWALGDTARVSRLIDDPLAQRLLVAYALARVGDIVDNDPESANDYYATGARGYADAASGNPHVTLNPQLQVVANALQQQGIGQIAGLDRAAALAYRSGSYALAQTLAAHQHSALSSWVLAKLALRRGDTATAAQAYADAIKGFPPIAAGAAPLDASVEPQTQLQVRAEQAVLTLSRGQYVEAFEQLYAVSAASQSDGANEAGLVSPVFGNYTGDSVYLAERVLTTDEFKRFVDRHLAATAIPPPPSDVHDMNSYWRWRGEHPPQLSDRFRLILARRLMRDGRFAEALTYFPSDDDWRYRQIVDDETTGQPSISPLRVRSSAKAYAVALYTAQHAWRANTRAQAWYRAAQLARNTGMEIMGTEQAPDFAEFGGDLGFGRGRSPALNTPPATPPTSATQRAAADLSGPFITEGERQRYAASEARPFARYHYRNLASDHAMRAADALPPRSQAFAAVLCQGVSYVIYQPEQIAPLYRRYLKEGAAVPFAADFGRDCPQPDFAAAADFSYRRLWRHRLALCLGALALLAVAALIWRRRARR